MAHAKPASPAPPSLGLLSLHLAAHVGDLNSLRNILERGASVDELNTDGMTPLQCATESGQLEAVQFLLERNADVNKPCLNGGSALHFACDSARTELTAALLDGKADLNKQDSQGLTPLMVAAACSRFNIANLLLNRKADPRFEVTSEFATQNPTAGKTALDFAKSRRELTLTALLVVRSAFALQGVH